MSFALVVRIRSIIEVFFNFNDNFQFLRYKWSLTFFTQNNIVKILGKRRGDSLTLFLFHLNCSKKKNLAHRIAVSKVNLGVDIVHYVCDIFAQSAVLNVRRRPLRTIYRYFSACYRLSFNQRKPFDLFALYNAPGVISLLIAIAFGTNCNIIAKVLTLMFTLPYGINNISRTFVRKNN